MYMTMFHSSFYCTTVTGDGTFCHRFISGTIPRTSFMHPFESGTWIWPHYYSHGAHHVPQPVCFPSNPQPGFLEQGYFEPSCVDPMFPFDPNCDIVAPKPSQESYYGIGNSQENHYPPQHFQENYFPVNNSLQNDTTSKQVSSLMNNNYCPSLETSAFFLGIPIFQESNPIVLYHIPSTDLCYVYVRCELIDGRKSHYLCEGCFLKKKYVLGEVSN
ncbi:unnamed protein product [Angiostrongylus costaricensis]|uniref:Ovule protein n=1 Tax=Angiostrongylus costaricensis TaxID=334426 RepID=A0A0R3PGL5_ANGCS|nr:unnamed protein product [Angiostrongylus costaricensis]